MRNKNILKVLSLLAAVCITAGCNGSTMAETTTVATNPLKITTTTTAEFTEETGVTEQTIEPIPEGWSVEKIAALIEIDGNPLKFPCTPEEFESLSEKITLGEPDEYFNYCDIYYDDVNIGTFALSQDNKYCNAIHFDINNFYNTNIVNLITINYCKIDDARNINLYLDDNFKHNNISNSDNGFCFKNYLWDIDEQSFSLSLVFDGDKMESIALVLN